MWYEILPGLGLMSVCLMMPGFATTVIQKYMNGGKEKRVARAPWQWYLIERDRRVAGTGNSFDIKGLENIN
ncbi:NADH dehydrogenase [ubiquinone] 1 alpha subcomplex subunit 1 [Salarias fasciatus]|uniref:NADH dehydrogenase [ubiquinone] 1 alpha subcomplex subunit 1 n=1 Tax=Salarias fasciatus TaxID=181472 RepID=A0A672GTE0_SALFA|nr:NADH dehydrogenase [ubiquinone] 1 alpha subcomplex subunit 1 [Salarias fasciatus]